MRERMMFFTALRVLLNEGSGWSHAKTDGVLTCIRGSRSAGVYAHLASDGTVTTLRYGGLVGVARRNPADLPVPCVGIAVAARDLAHTIRGRA